jgi:hypothetical protein
MFKSLRRRDILILVTFWLSMACIVGLALIFFMLRPPDISQPGPGEPAYSLEPAEVTALKLYPLAYEAALAWEEDVQFVSASATWPHASLSDLEGPVEWLFRFYSPGQKRILFVIVTPDMEIIARPHLARVRRELRVIDPATWQVDSPEAMTAWLNQGEGGVWLDQAADRTVSAQLTFSIAKNQPVWTISGLNPETGQSITFSTSGGGP